MATAHAEGTATVKTMDGVVVVKDENLAETIDVQNSMTSMINFDDAKLLFPTSSGYFNPRILETAPKHPDVRCQHIGGRCPEGMPTNAVCYFGYIGTGQYLNGITAGHATTTKKIDFVVAKPIFRKS